MHVFLRRRSGQKHTYDYLTGSLIAVSMLAVALIFCGAARDSFADDGDSVEVAPDPSAAPSVFSDSISPDSGWPDSNWEETNQVLEIPQTCSQDGIAVACDQRADTTVNDSSSSGDDDDEEDVETVGPVRTAPTLDQDATGNDPAVATQQWGSVGDYENEVAEAPMIIPPTGWAVASAYPMNSNSGPRMALMAARSPWHWTPMAMSSPLTPAARPPLNQGPWMTSSAMTWNRPAGSPMIMPNMSFRMR